MNIKRQVLGLYKSAIHGTILNREGRSMEIYYTPQEVADKLKINVRTLYRWIREGKLKAVKVGELWRISETELNRLLNKEESTNA